MARSPLSAHPGALGLALSLPLVLSAALAGCAPTGGSGSDGPSPSTASSEIVEVTIDGDAIEFPEPWVKCDDGNDGFTLTARAGEGDAQFSIVLDDAAAASVDAVLLRLDDGSTLNYSASSGSGSATATKSGTTYSITGESVLLSGSPGMPRDGVPFRIAVTCP